MNYRISIPKPCLEDWNAMTPNEQGRFCMQCAKTVTDFTGMSTPEIQSYLLANSDKKVCGRFRGEQLEKITINIPESVLYTQTRFRNIFMLALLVTMGTTLLSCNDRQQTIGDIQIVESDSTVASTDSMKPPSPDKKACIKDSTVLASGNATEFHLTGAVAVDPVPPPEEEFTPMMGDIAISPVTDTVTPPPKVQPVKAPVSKPEDIKHQ